MRPTPWPVASSRLSRPAALAVLCAAAALAGCGLRPSVGPDSGVQLLVTRDFGARSVLDLERPKVAAGDSVLAVLTRNAHVIVAGGAVGSIDGVVTLSGTRWFVYINGIEDATAPAKIDVHPGDRIWLDRHATAVAPHVPALVGAFPEPFVHGSGGRRLPVRIECADTGDPACDVVANKLLALGVPFGRSDLSTSAADVSLRLLVGPWKALRGRDAEADRIDAGPGASGIFARFDPAGADLVVLDARGRPTRTLGPATGLIAATRLPDRQPVWFVTGTDAAGVSSAARAFDESALGDRFALAVSRDLPVAVPAAVAP